MTSQPAEYLLAHAPNEVERLRFWGRVWEPAAEAMLDAIEVQRGWHCCDLGCGPFGILGALSRRVGPTGRVVGVDLNPAQVAAAQQFATDSGFTSIEVVQGDAYQTGLPDQAFDLVHARFIFAPLGRDEALLREMLRLTRPGGVIAIEEPDEAGYQAYPSHPAWDRLKALTIEAFSRGGGDYNAGRRMYSLLRDAGLDAVDARAAVLALPAGHRYRLWPLESTTAVRPRMIEWGLTTAAELDAVMGECERIANDPQVFLTSFMVTQVWGRKPANS